MKKQEAKWSVFPRGAGWVLAYQSAPGKWQQHRCPSTIVGKRAAAEYARTWLAERAAANTLPDGSDTIAKLSTAWLAMRMASPKIARSTARDNAGHMNNHVVPRFGDVPIGRLDVPMLRAWIREIRDGKSSSSVRNILSTLSAFYEDARAEGWCKATSNIVRHPGVTKEVPEADGEGVVMLPLDLATKLCAAEAVPLDRRLRYVLGLSTGLRDGELAGLKWLDVHLDDATPWLDVARAFALRADPTKYAALTRTKTRGSLRRMPLNETATAWLLWWRARGFVVLVGHDPRAEDAVLASRNGRHHRPKSAGLIREDLEAAGCATSDERARSFDFHSTRRSFATWLDAAGVDGSTIDELMGHAKKTTAQRNYTAKSMTLLGAAVALLPIRCAAPCADAQREPVEATDATREAAPDGTDREPPSGARAHEESASAADENAPLDVAAGSAMVRRPPQGERRFSSVVEQRFRKPSVAGSIPAIGSMFFLLLKNTFLHSFSTPPNP